MSMLTANGAQEGKTSRKDLTRAESDKVKTALQRELAKRTPKKKAS
jgi:hypothetical protein